MYKRFTLMIYDVYFKTFKGSHAYANHFNILLLSEDFLLRAIVIKNIFITPIIFLCLCFLCPLFILPTPEIK